MATSQYNHTRFTSPKTITTRQTETHTHNLVRRDRQQDDQKARWQQVNTQDTQYKHFRTQTLQTETHQHTLGRRHRHQYDQKARWQEVNTTAHDSQTLKGSQLDKLKHTLTTWRGEIANKMTKKPDGNKSIHKTHNTNTLGPKT